jgi:hypothetical protein
MLLCFLMLICVFTNQRVSEILKPGWRLTSKMDSVVRDFDVRYGFIGSGNPGHRQYMACVGSVCY